MLATRTVAGTPAHAEIDLPLPLGIPGPGRFPLHGQWFVSGFGGPDPQGWSDALIWWH